ncbi:MAG: Fic family protein [Patescibacteria group bacterium]
MKKPSTKSKGTTTYKESAHGILSHRELLPLELEGTKRGLEFIAKIFTEQDSFEINSELILKLHGVSYAWIFPDWAGKFRTIQVRFSDVEAPQYYKVPELVTNLCDDLKERLNHNPDPVQLLAWFQHEFVYIHPFQDYNGRTARMLSYLLMLIMGMIPSEIKADSLSDRNRYLKAMQSADSGDYSKLEGLIKKSIKK